MNFSDLSEHCYIYPVQIKPVFWKPVQWFPNNVIKDVSKNEDMKKYFEQKL